MKLNRIFAAFAILAATATASFATTIDVTWTSCTGATNINTTGGGALDAYVSCIGQNQAAQSYEVWAYGGAPGGTPDAWRFDPSGCEGSAFFTLNHLATAAVIKTCPSFQDPTLASLQIKDYAYDGTTGKVRIVLANAYPNNGAGNPLATDPTKRYFLANWHFDMTFAVVGPSDPNAGTCGGVGVPFCWALTRTNWLDTANNEVPFVHGKDYVTVNDVNNAQNCPAPVPAQPRTWGSIKGQYR